MSRRRIRVEVRDKVFVLRGWRANELAAEAGVRVIWAGGSAGWMGDRSRLGDVLAYFDHRHLSYLLDDVDQGELFSGGGAA